jgi:hypothetical protein
MTEQPPSEPRSPEEHGELWAAIGAQDDRIAYLRRHWPYLVRRIEAEAALPSAVPEPTGLEISRETATRCSELDLGEPSE